jgi:hypothetical protein
LVKKSIIIILLLNFWCGFAFVNQAYIEQESLVFQEELINYGTISVTNALALYKKSVNEGTIESGKVLVNGAFMNHGTVQASTIYVTAGCTMFENRGVLKVDALYLPVFGTHIKLSLKKQTVIGALYRGQEFLGGITCEPDRFSKHKVIITITDDKGRHYTFSGTQKLLEQVLENALNEKINVIALVAYLQKMIPQK